MTEKIWQMVVNEKLKRFQRELDSSTNRIRQPKKQGAVSWALSVTTAGRRTRKFGRSGAARSRASAAAGS